MNNNGFFDLKGAKCIVLGIGRSNEALISYLDKQGAEIFVSDKRKSEKEITDILQNKGIKNAGIIKYVNFQKADYVFRTPSIRPDAPEIMDAISKGAILTSESELFFEVAKGKIYGITGSDGKTTTTTLIYELLKRKYGEKRIKVGGNIGIPPISFVDQLDNDSITVLELSSFQLMTLRKSPICSAVTNITENHIDYHKSMNEYVQAKCNIFDCGGCEKLVIQSECSNILKKHIRSFPKNVLTTSLTDEKAEITCFNESIYFYGEKILDCAEIKAIGKHNVCNFMTAIGMTYPTVFKSDIQFVAKEFNGVEHRLEFVREINRVRYYNSSIDSTPSRTLATLDCFNNGSVVLICGGYDKCLSYTEFANNSNKKVNKYIIFGENKLKIADALKKANVHGFKIVFSTDLKSAIFDAATAAMQGDNVLLSPASASFDMFRDFEERGNLFKNIIKSL